MIKPWPTALPRPRSLEENAKWISRTFCLHILIVISELIGSSKDFLGVYKVIHIALALHFTSCMILKKERNIQKCSRSLDWPLIGHDELLIGLSPVFVQLLSSHHPWQGIREHILPMYLLLSSPRGTDYKNPQKTLHIYISVCHNSLDLLAQIFLHQSRIEKLCS